MNITTEFNIGDTVYAVNEGKIKEFTVKNVHVFIGDYTLISYTMASDDKLTQGPIYHEEMTGASPEALTEKMLQAFNK